ncbi:diguanylate cyclase [Duganella callida]|uniref:Diguanylate cyclase n=2 Tax=Duganella callida TaxID=2561932 RepID=A0A4Y9SKV6_9BURK|nr:diguanylate cyclase [Duganella callida]
MEAHVLSLMFIDAKEIALAASSRTDVLGTSYADRNYSPGDDTAHILGSIGIALDPDAGGDADTLMKHADQAMYSAKQDGRNHYNYYAKPPKVAKTAEN